ncbi:MAG: hypothetical protein MJZ34_07215 [Paludibacteraceae bacterium]|nr:hypothetical protein [Paludibacteraceae bacterium]
MPNWAYNRLEIKANKEKLEEIKNTLKIEDNDIDFDSLCENGNYGCKWNASEACLEDDDDDKIAYIFNTPWNPPTTFLEKLCEKWRDVEVNYVVTEEANLFVGMGSNVDGNFMYIQEDDIFSENNIRNYILNVMNEKGLNADDYDIDSIVEEAKEKYTWDVDDYDFENEFEEIALTLYDDDAYDSLVESFDNFKN